MKAVIHYSDGSSSTVCTDGTWLQSQATSWNVSSPSPVNRSGSGDGYIERIVAANLAPTWFMPGFSGTNSYANASVYRRPDQ